MHSRQVHRLIIIAFTCVSLFMIYTHSSFAQQQKSVDQCFACHSAIDDKASTLYKNDVHFAKGLSCAECHGGDSSTDDQEAAMNKQKGFIGVPKKNGISERCARCHNDPSVMKKFAYDGHTGQLDALTKSVHGKSSSQEGERIIQCTTCHGNHGIKHVRESASTVSPKNIVAVCSKCHSDANYMKQYNPSLPVDQLEKYRTSIHGKLNASGDLHVAECASCHGSHNIQKAQEATSQVNAFNIPTTCAKCHSNADYMKRYNISTDQFDDFSSSVHGVALLNKHDAGAPSCNDCHGNHGAVPPGVSSISNVCGTCHAINSQLFSKSIHKKIFDEQKLPECETCHSKHDIQPPTESLLSVGENTVCGKCHSETKAPKGFQGAIFMMRLIDSLKSMENLSASMINEAEQKGMEISEAKFKLRDVRQARLESRTMVHSFDLKQFDEVINKGLAITNTTKLEAEAALNDYYFRRWGLGISTLIITLLVFGIFIYIRRIERSDKST